LSIPDALISMKTLEGSDRIREPTGVDRYGQALLLDPGIRGLGPTQDPGQVADQTGQARRRLGRDHPALRRGPALVAVLTQDDQLAAVIGDGVSDLVEPTEREHLSGRATGDHRDRAHLSGKIVQDAAGIGVDARHVRVVHDRRQRPVEVERDQEPPARTDHSGVLISADGGAELHGPSQSEGEALRLTGSQQSR
jgi:hypothetical protein